MYDIAIIGAGPAGATLARLLESRYKVLMLDRRTLQEGGGGRAEKCCGGLLAPDAQLMLARLGLGLPRHVLAGPQFFTVRTLDLDNNLERFYQRHYINVDREGFDRWLVSLMGNHVTCLFGCLYKSHKETGDGVEVVYSQKGRLKQVRTRILVGADGANSLVRRHQFPDRPFPKRYISVQEWVEGTSGPYFTSIFDRQITDFYSWVIPKENHIILGTALPLGCDVNSRLLQLKEKLAPLGFTFGHCSRRKGTFIYRPTRLNQLLTGGGRTLLIGEAAGWISPSSAEGISYAMKSAMAMAEGLNDELEDCCSACALKMRRLKQNILLKNLKSPFMYHRGLRQLVMRSGVMCMKVAQ